MPSGYYIRKPENESRRIAKVVAAIKGKKRPESWIKARSGSFSHMWKGGRTEHKFICEHCQKEFIKVDYPTPMKYKYCSLSCSSKAVKRTPEWYQKVSTSLKEYFNRKYPKKDRKRKNEYVFFTRKLKDEIRNRDNYQCQLCGKTEIQCNKKNDIHHIDYDKKNYNYFNLISLCKSCHMRTNFSREFWREVFPMILNEVI